METPEKSRAEFEEDCMLQFKKLIQECENKHLKSVIDEDEYLRTFLIGRKFNVKNAFDTANSHMIAKHGKYRHIFEMPPESVQHIIESGLFGLLKNRDHHGRAIGFLRIPKLDIKTMEFDEITRAATLLIDHLWYDRKVSESGQVFILDYSGYSFQIFKRYSFMQKLNFVTLFLSNYPTKFKEVHIYNNPKLVSYTYSLIRPFLPEKLRNRIFLHSHNRENLLNHFSPDILPVWMGGNILDDDEAVDFTLITKVLENANKS